jgi:hypothetical protein
MTLTLATIQAHNELAWHRATLSILYVMRRHHLRRYTARSLAARLVCEPQLLRSLFRAYLFELSRAVNDWPFHYALHYTGASLWFRTDRTQRLSWADVVAAHSSASIYPVGMYHDHGRQFFIYTLRRND